MPIAFPVYESRIFAADTPYNSVDWDSIESIALAFKKRVTLWYIEPVKMLKERQNEHTAYAALFIARELYGLMELFLPELNQFQNKVTELSNAEDIIFYGSEKLSLRLGKVGDNVYETDYSGKYTVDKNGEPYPTLTVNPWKLVEQLEQIFNEYVGEVLKGQNVSRFKEAFTDYFVVDIRGAA